LTQPTQPLRMVSTRFAAVTASVSAARAWIAGELLREGADRELIDRVELLVSEVVTNAVRHTDSTQLTLTVRTGTYVEVSVHDDDRRLPTPRHAGPDDQGGRGLLLVEELSDAWGTRPAVHGKWVWFHVTSRPRS
jgi:anti-sigma regulatory factor (Ser/Thr protein kinase)